MEYIIKKDVCGFSYYLGKHGRWEGLKDNAVTFRLKWDAEKEVSVLYSYNPNDKFEVITVNTES